MCTYNQKQNYKKGRECVMDSSEETTALEQGYEHTAPWWTLTDTADSNS